MPQRARKKKTSKSSSDVSDSGEGLIKPHLKMIPGEGASDEVISDTVIGAEVEEDEKPKKRKETRVAPSKGGLLWWMGEVDRLIDDAREELGVDTVHDLRVAIRNCRSMAQGLSAVAPHPSWADLDGEGKSVFKALGKLRDTHVLIDWVEKLAPDKDSVRRWAARWLAEREENLIPGAQRAVKNFNEKAWKKAAKKLGEVAMTLEAGGEVFQHLAVQRFADMIEGHNKATSTLYLPYFHDLRVDIKRFRYTVENFLPEQKKAWRKDLKHLQDLLGEVSDLEILQDMIQDNADQVDASDLKRWDGILDVEIRDRLSGFLRLTDGPESLYYKWREGLLEGEELQKAALRSLEVYAFHADTNYDFTIRIAKRALGLYDQLVEISAPVPNERPRDREILQAAAILHGLGRSDELDTRGKIAAKEIREITPPCGWAEGELELVSLVVRYHQGAMPKLSNKRFASLSPYARWLVKSLAGILRFSAALDSNPERPLEDVRAELAEDVLHITATGYQSQQERDNRLVKEKALLEQVIARPIHVHPA